MSQVPNLADLAATTLKNSEWGRRIKQHLDKAKRAQRRIDTASYRLDDHPAASKAALKQTVKREKKLASDIAKSIPPHFDLQQFRSMNIEGLNWLEN